jgi:hypothetical protein
MRLRTASMSVGILCTLLTIAFTAESEACFRRGRCHVVSSNPFGLPWWVRWHLHSDRDGPCPPPSDANASVCWCCQNGTWMRCSQTTPCPAGSAICLPEGALPIILCPRDGEHADCACRSAGSIGSACICAMICDAQTQTLRFAYPCEFSGRGYGYYPLRFHGFMCREHPAPTTTAEPPVHE